EGRSRCCIYGQYGSDDSHCSKEQKSIGHGRMRAINCVSITGTEKHDGRGGEFLPQLPNIYRLAIKGDGSGSPLNRRGTMTVKNCYSSSERLEGGNKFFFGFNLHYPQSEPFGGK